LTKSEVQVLIKRYQRLKRLTKKRTQERVLRDTKFLPSQRSLIKAYNDPDISIILFVSGNQIGKSFVLTANLIATALGYQPWDGRLRPHAPPVKIALLLPDYENHAQKWVSQNLLALYPEDRLGIRKTQSGAPREILFKETGSLVHIFTQDQDPVRLEGGTWHELYMDEPLPRSHLIALQRGLSRFSGKTILTMTPLSEPYIFDELYSRAGNNGGDRKEIFAITAWPDENLKSRGGHLDDETVGQFRQRLSIEEKEARVYGRWMHLIGRVYKDFDERIHVISDDPFPPEQCPHGLVVDPHDRIPFAMAWFYITPKNEYVFYQEWPTEPFEKMRYCELDVDDYARIIRAHPRTLWRIIDPNRSRARSVHTGYSLSEEFRARGIGFIDDVLDDLIAGHRQVASLLSYDRSKPIGNLNAPHLYVKQNCHNIIKAFKNYIWDDWRPKAGVGKSPKQKPKEEYKHFMDCIRYAATSHLRFMERDKLRQLYGGRGLDRGIYRGWERRSLGDLYRREQQWA
jgi:hypothetical protein